MVSLAEFLLTVVVLAVVAVIPKLKSLHFEFKEKKDDEPN